MEIEERIKTLAKEGKGVTREGGNRFVQGNSLDVIPC